MVLPLGQAGAPWGRRVQPARQRGSTSPPGLEQWCVIGVAGCVGKDQLKPYCRHVWPSEPLHPRASAALNTHSLPRHGAACPAQGHHLSPSSSCQGSLHERQGAFSHGYSVSSAASCWGASTTRHTLPSGFHPLGTLSMTSAGKQVADSSSIHGIAQIRPPEEERPHPSTPSAARSGAEAPPAALRAVQAQPHSHRTIPAASMPAGCLSADPTYHPGTL